MALRSLNQLLALRHLLVGTRKRLLARRGVRVHPSATISLASRFLADGGAITIGAESLVAFKALLITRTADGREGPITIGRRCFIGSGVTVLPGVTIGSEVVVGAGAVVDRDIPDHSLVAGVPARVVRSGVSVGRWGRLPGADERARELYQ